MNRKNFSIVVIIVLLATIIYYFTSGSEQITAQMKAEVEKELVSLQKEGFSVQNRKIQEKQEHFTLSFDEPKKIATFLSHQGLQINANDAEILKGLQVGVDVNYLADTYSAVSFDMYLVALPAVITSSATNAEDKKALAEVEKMLEKKTFLMHVAINKLGSGFKGHMKDIQETLHGEKDVNLTMKGLTFLGDIKESTLQSMTQNVDTLSIQIPHEVDVRFNDFESEYTATGNTPYDYLTKYNITHMKIYAPSQLNIEAHGITTESDSHVKDGLAAGSALAKIKSMKFEKASQAYALENLDFNIHVKNLDVTALEKLQKANVYDPKEVNKMLQTLVSKGIHIEVPSFSIASIIDEKGVKIDGFNLSAKADVDKSFDIASLESNPMVALSAINAKVKLELSNSLYSMIAQQPQAIMLIMLFQPKDVNNQKVYEIELKDGKSMINGMPLL